MLCVHKSWRHRSAQERQREAKRIAKVGCTTRDKHGRCANTRIVAMRGGKGLSGGGHRASHEAWWSRSRDRSPLWRAKSVGLVSSSLLRRRRLPARANCDSYYCCLTDHGARPSRPDADAAGCTFVVFARADSLASRGGPARRRLRHHNSAGRKCSPSICCPDPR